MAEANPPPEDEEIKRQREEAEEKGRVLAKELELQKKREEAERKARRGEIDPTHEFTFQVHLPKKIHTYLPILSKNFRGVVTGVAGVAVATPIFSENSKF